MVSSSPLSRIGGVIPAWLEPRLSVPSLRILDVRTDAPADASGPRLRASSTIDLRSYAHLGAPATWQTPRARRSSRPGPSAAFAQGHIPNAVPLDVRALLFDDDGDVVSAPELAIVMSSLGVGDGHTVVLVDEGRPEAGLAAAWALIRYGHGDVHMLEGGWARWVGEGRAVSQAMVKHPPASFTAKVSTAPGAS